MTHDHTEGTHGKRYLFTRSWGKVPPGEGRRARFGDPREPRDIAYIDPHSRPWRGYLLKLV